MERNTSAVKEEVARVGTEERGDRDEERKLDVRLTWRCVSVHCGSADGEQSLRAAD